MVVMSDTMRAYFEDLDAKIEDMYAIARAARARGGIDPAAEPETNVASDIAGRVEELVGPKGIAAVIREWTSQGMDRDKVAFKIAEKIVDERKGDGIQQAADLAIRCALAIKTEGVVSAPLEGISEIRVKEEKGAKYLSLYFAGPIRAAGGTTQAYVVLLADHIRKRLGLDMYVPTEQEVARYIEEIKLYDRVVNLQYTSSPAELDWVVRHLPVEVTGDQTNKEEVSANRNLPRVETNCIRGGACLVINDGVLAKASKINKLIHEMQLPDWDWLKNIPKEKHQVAQDDGKDKKFGDDLFQGEKKDEKKEKRVEPKDKFIAEVIAGRPIFAHPSAHGGFRVRYGRARNMGLAGYGVHPASMYLTDSFIAVGTQMRVERPGKSTVAMPVDSIEGPVVRMRGGSVVRVESTVGISKMVREIEQVLFLGDVLIGFGEFLENNHTILPSPHVEEWWIQDVKHAMADRGMDEIALAAATGIDIDTVNKLVRDFFYTKPTARQAIDISKQLAVPLHPRYMYFWNAITVADIERLRSWLLDHGTIQRGEDGNVILRCAHDVDVKKILERLCIPHVVSEDGYSFTTESEAIIETLALETPAASIDPSRGSALGVLEGLSTVPLRDKAPYFMGMRMGRPEKAKERKMSPPVHLLFPLGHECGNQRLFQDALKKRIVKVDIANRICPSCKTVTFLPACQKCKARTAPFKYCARCHKGMPESAEKCPACGMPGQYHSSRAINLVELYGNALKRVNVNVPDIKAVKGMSSLHKMPEPLEKGMLRAKHGVFVYKDGTIRFDTGDCPLTHFTPKEVFVPVEKLVSLGYTHDIHGEPLERPEQVLELKIQDILLPKASLKYFLQASKFIDELLERVYGLPPYYNIKKEHDFIGHVFIGLAPHTSAGVAARAVGFTLANVGYAHPTYHAAKRRNCDGDEDGILLFLDVILNFSRMYLPSSIGAKMDTPLVISNRVVPEEVDGEAHNVDTAWSYPLEFYTRSQEYPDPKEIAKLMDTLKKRLNTVGQYEGLGFTHPTSSINEGPKVTAYKELESMEDKLVAQFGLARKLAAVDAADQARRVIQTHFTPDIMGNLRAFTTQTFRCSKCNAKYRRPPLQPGCPKCGNPTLALTVSPGSIKKYLELALGIAKDYNLSAYTRQKIDILAERVESTTFNGTKKQLSLSQFF